MGGKVVADYMGRSQNLIRLERHALHLNGRQVLLRVVSPSIFKPDTRNFIRTVFSVTRILQEKR